MKRFLFLFAALVIALAIVPTAAADPIVIHHGHEAAAGHALVVPAPTTTAHSLHANLSSRGFAVARVSTYQGLRVLPTVWLRQNQPPAADTCYLLVTFDPRLDLDEALDELESLPGVAEAWPNHILRPFWVPNDPMYDSHQLNLRQIKLERVWDRTLGGNIIVAVVDTGYLNNGLTDGAIEVLDGWDFGEGDDDPNDTEGHGTHVSNIIAAEADNGIGIAGIAPNIRLLPVKVFPDYSGGAYEGDVIDGVNWAVEQGARVINMSLGGAGFNGLSEHVINNAVSYGTAVVAASGNESTVVSYPARYDDVIAVGSCDKHAVGEFPTRSDYSNFGEGLDVMAPGENIVAETMGGSGVGFYGYWGTSVASPHVAGAAALLIATAPDGSDIYDVREALEQTASSPYADWDLDIGWGEIDVYAALESFSGGVPNQSPTATIIADPLEGQAPLKVSFTAGASDPDGYITHYLWSFSSGDSYNSPVFSHTFKQAGQYTILLSVTDSEGASGSDQVVINVSQAPKKDEEEDDSGCAVGGSGGDTSLPTLVLILISLGLLRRLRPAGVETNRND